MSTNTMLTEEDREIAEIVEWMRSTVPTLTETDHDDPFYADSYKRWNWGWIDQKGENHSARGVHICVPILREFWDEIDMAGEPLDDSNSRAVGDSDDLTALGLRKGWTLYMSDDDKPMFSSRWLQKRTAVMPLRTLYEIIYGDETSSRYNINLENYADKQSVLQAIWNLLKSFKQPGPAQAQPMLKAVGESITEGAKVTSALVQKVLTDYQFTFGFEAEFVLTGLHSYMLNDSIKDAAPDKRGTYTKLGGMSGYDDLMRYWGPLQMTPEEKQASLVDPKDVFDDPHARKAFGPVIKSRLRDVFEDEIRPFNDEDFARGLDYRAVYAALINRFGFGRLAIRLKIVPAAGFAVSSEQNIALKNGVLRGDDGIARDIEHTRYYLFYTDEDNTKRALTTDHTEDALESGVFALARDETSRELFLNSVAGDIQQRLGNRVAVSTTPESNSMVSGGYSSWVLVEDGSVAHDNIETAGLELISPATNLQQGFANLEKAFGVIGAFPSDHEFVRAYTDKTTGLHLNLGLKNFDPNRFDALKMIFLLGEEHLLKQFGRIDNDHARPMLDKIKSSLLIKHAQSEMNPSANDLGVLTRDEVAQVFGFNRNNLEQVKQTLINVITTKDHGGKAFDKYLSVNLKKLASDGFIEFRITGNKAYEQRLPEIKQIVYRYAVIMLAAYTDLYQNVYLTKLYKLLAGLIDTTNADPMAAVRFGNLVSAVTQNPLGHQWHNDQNNPLSFQMGNLYASLDNLVGGREFDPVGFRNQVKLLDDRVRVAFAMRSPDRITQLKWASLRASLVALLKAVGKPLEKAPA